MCIIVAVLVFNHCKLSEIDIVMLVYLLMLFKIKFSFVNNEYIRNL